MPIGCWFYLTDVYKIRVLKFNSDEFWSTTSFQRLHRMQEVFFWGCHVMGWTSDQEIWTNWGSTLQQGTCSHVWPCFKMMFTPPSKVPQTTRSYHFVAPKSICIHLDFWVKLPSYFCLKDPHVHSPSFSPPCGYAENIGWKTHQVHRVRYIDFNVATTLESCSQVRKHEFWAPKR